MAPNFTSNSHFVVFIIGNKQDWSFSIPLQVIQLKYADLLSALLHHMTFQARDHNSKIIISDFIWDVNSLTFTRKTTICRLFHLQIVFGGFLFVFVCLWLTSTFQATFSNTYNSNDLARDFKCILKGFFPRERSEEIKDT